MKNTKGAKSLNSVIFENKRLLKESVSVFGSQCIVASIDIKKNNKDEYVLYSHSGRRVKYSLNECLDLLIESNIGEILINNVDLDGMMSGYDLNLIKHVTSLTKVIPIIAAGGASGPSDCCNAIKAGASAVAAASIFHFTSITPRICKEEMFKAGIPVRL